MRELVASCPRCKTLESLWFRGDILMPTKRFRQEKNGKVYHDCGSTEPCRLFPRFIGEDDLSTFLGFPIDAALPRS